MVDQRHDVICRLAVAGAARPGMATARLTLTEQTPVRGIGRIERRSLPRAPGGGPVPPACAAPERGREDRRSLAALSNKTAELPDPDRLLRCGASMMVDVRCAWNGATGVRESSTSLRAFPTCRDGALARSGWCLAAVLLVAFAALLALPLQAQAQTTLVSNTGKNNSSNRSIGLNDYPQAFGTGSNAAGFDLDGIVLDFAAAPIGTATLTVTVREEASGDGEGQDRQRTAVP